MLALVSGCRAMCDVRDEYSGIMDSHACVSTVIVTIIDDTYYIVEIKCFVCPVRGGFVCM